MDMGSVLTDYVLELSDYVWVRLSVEVLVLGYVLELSGYVWVCLFVGLSAVGFPVLTVGFHLLSWKMPLLLDPY